MNDAFYVTVIGAANIDIQGFTKDKLLNRDSNPGKVKICLGGVSRNISENLTRLGINTKLITAIGDDSYSKYLIDECTKIGIDMKHSLTIPNSTSSIYLAIMDLEGDMSLALSDMRIIDKLSIRYLKTKSNILENSSLIVIDACLSQDIIKYILNTYKDKKILLDPVSIRKSTKLKKIIGNFHTIKLNRHEAQFLSDIPINSNSDLYKASLYFIKKGVKRVFLTLGKDGVFYSNGTTFEILKPPKIKVLNATGAGDAFMAGIVYGTLHDKSIQEIALFSTATSILTLKHHETVNPNMSINKVNNIIRELF